VLEPASAVAVLVGGVVQVLDLHVSSILLVLDRTARER
jgi:hypothetical protein